MMTELSPAPSPAVASVTLAKFNELAILLEDLLRRIADSDDPHIRRLRAKVRAELIAIQTDLYGVETQAER